MAESAAERIAAKREAIEQERRDIALLEVAHREALAEKELEIQEQVLDEELERLRAEKVNAIRTVGGTVAEALVAMEQAAVVERPTLGASAVEPKDNTEGEGK